MWLKSLVLIFILAVNVTKIISSKVCILRLWASSFQTCCSFNVFQDIFNRCPVEGDHNEVISVISPTCGSRAARRWQWQRDTSTNWSSSEHEASDCGPAPVLLVWSSDVSCWPWTWTKEVVNGFFFCQLQPLYYFFNFYLEAAAGLTFPEQKGNEDHLP